MAKKSYLKQVAEAFGYLFIFAALLWLELYLMYWVHKAIAQLIKIILKPIGIKFPFKFKAIYQYLFSVLLSIYPGFVFQNQYELLTTGQIVVAVLLTILGFCFLTSALDKGILQKEKVSDWFNQRRIWCD